MLASSSPYVTSTHEYHYAPRMSSAALVAATGGLLSVGALTVATALRMPAPSGAVVLLAVSAGSLWLFGHAKRMLPFMRSEAPQPSLVLTPEGFGYLDELSVDWSQVRRVRTVEQRVSLLRKQTWLAVEVDDVQPCLLAAEGTARRYASRMRPLAKQATGPEVYLAVAYLPMHRTPAQWARCLEEFATAARRG